MEAQGNTGRSGREYGDSRNPAVLRGRLASDTERPVYPEDRCLQCEREGKFDSDTCFHRHWETADEPRVPERRVS